MIQTIPGPAIGKANERGDWIAPFAFHHSPEEEFDIARNPKPEEEEIAFRDKFGGSSPYYPIAEYYPAILNVVRARLSQNGGDITEAEDITNHVIGRAELLFQERALPDYILAARSPLNKGYKGRVRLQSIVWPALRSGSMGRFGRGFFSGKGIETRWNPGDRNHEYAIRPGVIMYRARKFADTCAFNGGYHRVSKGIENSVRGGGKFRSEHLAGYDENGFPQYEMKAARETAYDLAIHGAVNESPRSLAFGAQQVNAFEPAILARLSPSVRKILAVHLRGDDLDERMCKIGRQRNRRMVARLESIIRKAIADYLDNTAYATA